MPTYVAPSKDESRRLQLNKAASRAQQDAAAGQAVLSPDRVTELTAVAQRFDTAMKAVLTAEEIYEAQQGALETAVKALKSQVQQAWKTVQANVSNGVWPDAVAVYYPIPGAKSGLYPHSSEEWVNAAQSLLDGDTLALARAYPGLPTRSLLQAAYDSAKEVLDAFTEAREAQTAARQALGSQRDPANETIKLVVGDLRYVARQKSAADIRRLLRAYGAQFRYKQNEPVDAEDAAPLPEAA